MDIANVPRCRENISAPGNEAEMVHAFGQPTVIIVVLERL